MHVPIPPPPWQDLLARLGPDDLSSLLDAAIEDDKYLPWDKIIHLSPPGDLSSEQWWLKIKLGRLAAQKTVPLRDKAGRTFSFNMPDRVQEALHELDQRLAGRIAAPDADAITTPGLRDRYVVTSLIEEAITSSQLEGASTSRREAKRLLRSGRQPKDRSERMIVNNYRAMQRVRQLTSEPLSPSLVMDLHRIVTEGTLDDPDCAGRLERPDETRVRILGHDDQVLHVPPPAEELPQRIERMCAYANGELTTGFTHPLVRAIFLHFWMGYDHYFADGNGRTARAVFYWSVLRQGYWLAEFLTISAVLRRAPIRYAQSFLLTETDDNDLTYFLFAQLDVLQDAVASLHEYLGRKTSEIRQVEALLREGTGLNLRQRAVLGDALRNADATFTISDHRSQFDVVYQTARTDLLGLVEHELLTKTRHGNAFVFTVPADLTSRLAEKY